MGSQQKAKKVLLIGWDAADWKIIHQLIDAGKMPNMAKFAEEGVIGNLATLYPELSPMLWTSIATGKRPFKHGILSFTEPNPHSGGIRPITNLSRKTKAIWNILSQEGKKCIVVGWWPSHPAEPINGVMVSNHYQRAVTPHGKPWPMKPGSVHPERLIRNLAELRLHPQDLDPRLIMNFVPKLSEIDQEKDKRIENLAKIIADCTTINRAATAIMHHEPWDFTAIYFDAIDHFGHGFMNYHPPRLPWMKEKEFELYKLVVESGYIYHDILLGTLLERVGDDTIVMIVSDHGFHSDHLRPKNIPREPAGPAVQHRHYGIFAVKGPGILKDELIYGASLLDVCPTVLTMFDLPVGQDMDGKPLVNIYKNPPDFKTIPSWDDIAGNDGGHPPDKAIDSVDSQEAINQLVELGYIDKPDENKEKATKDSVRELRYNLSRSYIDAGNYIEAIPILEELLATWPDEYRFGIQLVTCYKSLDRIKEARTLIEDLFKRKKQNARQAAKDLKEFNKKNKDTSFNDLKKEDQLKFRNLRAQASRNPYAMEYLMGSLLFAEGDDKKALVHLENAGKADKNQPALYNKLGDVYLKMKLWSDAEKSFNKALSIDQENAEAHLGLCQSFLSLKRNRDAAEKALSAVGLLYHNPKGHFLLGVALHRIGRTYQAIEALKVAISQNPNHYDAHKRLAYIYKHRLKDDEIADKHSQLAKEAKERIKDILKGKTKPALEKEDAAKTSLVSSHDKISETKNIIPEGPVDLNRTAIIVSGLPRSGTSMMMQMLEAGGIPALTDSIRKADEDNPKGYFEYEKAKKLMNDKSWLPDSKGKAVKIVAQLLTHLPRIKELEYRIIFMERNLDEVLPSQHTMLKRKGKKGAQLSDEHLKSVFARQVQNTKMMLNARNIPTLFVDYNKTLTEPDSTALDLNKFLGGDLNIKEMTGTVNPDLQHQKA